jgi:hypothetical protein
VLVPGGSLICYLGEGLPEILPLMTPYLKFHRLLAEFHDVGGAQMQPQYGVSVTWKPLLWFTKGARRTSTMVRDSVKSEPGLKTMHHPWAQGLEAPLYYIQQLSRKGSLVVDTCLGGGTTGVAAIRLGRRFIGFEINPDSARKAEMRILGAKTATLDGSND